VVKAAGDAAKPARAGRTPRKRASAKR
jgi:hypothetical protein